MDPLFDLAQSWLFSQPVPPIELVPRLSLASGSSLVVAVVIVFGFFAWQERRSESFEGIEDIQAYLFFLPDSAESVKTLKHHRQWLDHRLVVNHKTTPPKAYYLSPGSFAWHLIERQRDFWVAETDPFPDEKNFAQKWCEQRNYKFIPRNASRTDLLERTNLPTIALERAAVPPSTESIKIDQAVTACSVNFEAGILEKKSSYHKGDTVKFWAKFTGELKNGGFTAKILTPDGTTDWWADELMKRALNGSGLHKREWDHEIPQNCPAGRSKVAIQVYGVVTERQELPNPVPDDFVVESGVQPTQQPTEIADFRHGVATEVHYLLKMFMDPLHHWDINYPSWSSKAEPSKAAIFGKEDYSVLRSLYDAIEERNRYFARGRGMNVAEVDPLNRTCLEAFSRAYSEITWLKIASDTDSLLSKARKNVGLP